MLVPDVAQDDFDPLVFLPLGWDCQCTPACPTLTAGIFLGNGM